MRFLFGVSLLVSGSVWATTQEWTLSGLAQQIQQNNVALIQAENNFLQSELDLSSARAGFLPTLNFESQLARSRQGWGSQASLVLSQNIYSNGQSLRHLNASEIAHQKARIELELARESLAYELVNAYANASLSKRRWEITKRKESLLEMQFDLARRQYRQGLKTQRDYQVLEAELERSRLSIEEMLQEIDRAYVDLEVLLGFDLGSIKNRRIKDWSGEWLLSQSAWFQTSGSKSHQLEIKQYQLQEDLTQISIAENKRKLWPELSLDASLGYGSHSWLFEPPTWRDNDDWTASVGLRLKWTLWDWGQNSNALQKSRAQLKVAQVVTRQKRIEIDNDWTMTLQNFERQKKGIEIRQKIRSLEQKSFSEIEREYREGKLNYLDLITALERDIQAQLSFEVEAFAFFKTRAQLKKYEGTLYESIQNL